eukprot:scaffold26586_cov126-Isochrysis_galbana.AAC.1
MSEAPLPKTPSRKGWSGEGFGESESERVEEAKSGQGQGETDGDLARACYSNIQIVGKRRGRHDRWNGQPVPPPALTRPAARPARARTPSPEAR